MFDIPPTLRRCFAMEDNVVGMGDRDKIDVYSEAEMKNYLCQVFTIVGKYENIWCSRPPTATRDRLKRLKSILGTAASMKLNVPLGVCIGHLLTKEKLSMKEDALNLITSPRYKPIPDEVIRDRNIFKNRFCDLLESLIELQKEDKWISQAKAFFKDMNEKDIMDELEKMKKELQGADLYQNVQEQKV